MYRYQYRCRYEQFVSLPPFALLGSQRNRSFLLGQGSHAYEKARQSLCAMPSMSEQEVLDALEKVGPPYGLQTVMWKIEALFPSVSIYIPSL